MTLSEAHGFLQPCSSQISHSVFSDFSLPTARRLFFFLGRHPVSALGIQAVFVGGR